MTKEESSGFVDNSLCDTQVMEYSDEFADALYLMGQITYKKGNAELALIYSDKWLEKNEKHKEAWWLKGIVLDGIGEKNE